MTKLDSKARLRWACRRGMLELDVLFRPFVDEAYDDLSEQDQRIFQRLLEGEDPTLFAWVMGHEKCEDPELAYMVDTVTGKDQDITEPEVGIIKPVDHIGDDQQMKQKTAS